MKKDIKNTIIVSLFILVLFTAVVGVDKLSSNNQPVQSKQTVQSEKAQPNEKPTANKHNEDKANNNAKFNNNENKNDVKTQKAKITVQAKESSQQPVVTNQPKQTASVATQQRTDANQTVNRGTSRSDELYWLARIVQAEAEGETFTGKVAIANVILNRVNSANFPNSIYGVIFDKQYGYTQFSPVLDGRIYNNPSAESYQAAQAALNGQRPVGSALYFLNPRKSENFWIPQNRQYMMSLDQHDFYY
jgi:N-acetylmuramoyl-L-alanine amidase